jgi:hypothetical protein
MGDDDHTGSDTEQDEQPQAKQNPDDQERLIPEEEISDDGQVYVDREKIDFDPEEGLYSGTAVHGGTDIPGPHEQVDDIDPNEADSGEDGGDDASGNAPAGDADQQDEDERDETAEQTS